MASRVDEETSSPTLVQPCTSDQLPHVRMQGDILGVVYNPHKSPLISPICGVGMNLFPLLPLSHPYRTTNFLQFSQIFLAFPNKTCYTILVSIESMIDEDCEIVRKDHETDQRV